MPEKQYTNGELGILIKDIHKDIKRLNKYIEGNGKIGLLDRMNNVENCAEITEITLSDLVEHKKKTHEKIIDIAWKVGTTAIFVILGIDKFN